ncbi:hypothetical protein N5P37_003003 [Trichoderma harzianum]|uniref:Uncharacterized protein n=1 Tax=Trichoderma harzianum CBS 226.95 TaxID=983964 RepID=A0A2T4AT95_TRIHA|nr:hypothetical protein M431DRAFT_295 [Trichoderma harzianum CBS 226.95]KAK0763624.1 hypothetical protein N5P37_003003 [Trichoderma harzianum]PTB60198.1 hypothetical protein M431DRAFT_295 [Trichoderma harzianum CBS 226.95]
MLTGQATSRPGSLSQGLSPITRAVYEKVGGYFKATKPNVVNPQVVVNGNKNRGVSKDMAIHPSSIGNHSARTDNYEAPQPPQSRTDPSDYVDATATSQPQVELETSVQQAPTALPASPDGHLTAVSVSFEQTA